MQANELLREMIRSRTITQRDLSTKLGRSQNYVSRMLAGGFNLRVGTLAEFCESLGYVLLIRDTNDGTEIIIDAPPRD